MKNSALNKLLLILYNKTKNGELIWSPESSVFNSITSYEYKTNLNKDTDIIVSVRTSDEFKLNGCSLQLINQKLINGRLYIQDSFGEMREPIEKIGELIYQIYIKPIIKTYNYDDNAIINEVCDSLSILDKRESIFKKLGLV